MKLEYFNHIFEFFAATNLALSSVNVFYDTIEKKISKSYSDIFELYRKLENKLQFLLESVKNMELCTLNGEANTDINRTALEKGLELQESLKVIKNEIDKGTEKIKITYGFSLICLFSGMYCIMCLIFAGIESSYANVGAIYCGLLFFNFFYIVFFIVMLYKDVTYRFELRDRIKKKFNPIHCIGYFLFFLIAIVVNLILFFITGYHFLNWIPNQHSEYAVISSICLPILPFPVYLTFYMILLIKLKKQIYTNLGTLDNNTETFTKTEYNNASVFIKAFELTKKPKNKPNGSTVVSSPRSRQFPKSGNKKS